MQSIKERLLEAKEIVLYNDEVIYVEPYTSDDVYGITAGRREWFLKENYWEYYESELMMSYLRSITVEEAMRIIESWDTEKTVDEPNVITYAAMEAVETGKDITGPFDTMADLMRSLESSESTDMDDDNIHLNSESTDALFLEVETYIAQNLIQDKPKSDFVVMDAKRWNEEKKLRNSKVLPPVATVEESTSFQTNAEPKELPRRDPFDSILALFRPAPCAEKDLESLLRETDASFSETLLKLIDRAGKRDSEIYKKANVDRKLFSKIRSNKDYRPSKTTALAFAIALELDLDEAKDLIGRAGYTLTHSSKLDIIVEYFIINKKYDINEINITLYHFDQPYLGL